LNWKLILIGILLGLFSFSTADVWLNEEILDHSGIGSACDLTIDSSGGLHVCFHYKPNTIPGSDLYYAYKADSSDGWEITQVAVSGGSFIGDDCRIDLDSSEYPHISYLYEVDWEYIPYVKYAAFDGASWQKEQLTFYPEYAERGTSIVIDGSDKPHLFYSLYGSGLIHEWNDGTDGWVSEVVEPGNCILFPTAMIDGAGGIGVAYYYRPDQWAEWDIHYAYHDGTSWTIETAFDANSCVSSWPLDLAFDQDDQPHIVCTASEATDNLSLLLHTWNSGSSWSTDNLGATGTGVYKYASVAVDDSNYTHIAYGLSPIGSDVGPLYHISDESDTWVSTMVKDDINSWDNAIEIAPDGQPHIVYYTFLGGITAHAWRTDETGIEEGPAGPVAILLGSPYPNPCSGSSSVEYTLNEDSFVQMELFDMSGRVITTLTEDFHQAGSHEVNVSDLSPGVYVFRLTASGFVETRKLVVL